MEKYQPVPFKIKSKRYFSEKAFPNYRHVPGKTPHPVDDPSGHSYKLVIPKTDKISNENWSSNSVYLYAIHEYLEALWKELDSESKEKLLIQAIIQSAAALIKWNQKNYRGMKKLFTKSLIKVNILLNEENSPTLLGIDLLIMNRLLS